MVWKSKGEKDPWGLAEPWEKSRRGDGISLAGCPGLWLVTGREEVTGVIRVNLDVGWECIWWKTGFETGN